MIGPGREALMQRRVFLGSMAAGAVAGGRVDWDPATEEVRDNPRAAALLGREHRAPFVHPWRG
jgi:hypothetical protein